MIQTILMTVINTGFRARKSFWLNAWSELLFFLAGYIYIYIYFFFFFLFLIYGLETELSGLAAKKLMY